MEIEIDALKIYEFPIDQIIIKNRARKDHGDIPELAGQIAKVGQLVPILIDDNFNLIAGERRILAHKHLKRDTILTRILPGITPSNHRIIELMENVDRKAFNWDEELMLHWELHTMWKKKAEASGSTWGYRETAKRLGCSLGGLSTDLELAAGMQYFPKLAECTTKGRAKEAYKQLGQQAQAIQHMNNLPDAAKARMEKLMAGEVKPIKPKKDQLMTETSSSSAEAKVVATYEDNVNETIETTPISRVDLYKQVVYTVENYKTFLSKLPDNTVGLVELDPPYAIGYDENYVKARKQKGMATDWDEIQLYEFYQDYLPILFTKMIEHSWVICWTGKEHATQTRLYAEQCGFTTQPEGIWVKPGGGVTNKPKKIMVSNYETYLLFAKGNPEFNTNSLPAAVLHNTVPAKQRIHTWEKPLGLYNSHFMPALAKPGTIFFSPFAGSGNSMIAAYDHRMMPIGCDIDKKYVAQFYMRLENHLNNR